MIYFVKSCVMTKCTYYITNNKVFLNLKNISYFRLANWKAYQIILARFLALVTTMVTKVDHGN